MHDTQNTDNNTNDRLMGTCPICHDRHVVFEPTGRDRGRQMAQCGACGSIVALPKVQGGDGPIDHSRPRTFVEIVRSAQAGLHEVHDALAELGVEGSIPTHIAEEVRRELVALDDKVTDLAEFVADVARGNRPKDLRALEDDDPVPPYDEQGVDPSTLVDADEPETGIEGGY